MKISKIMVQVHHSRDTEARYWDWEDANGTYEELKKRLETKWDGWTDGVRLVEKTFDEGTFCVYTRVIKTTMRKRNWNNWNEWTIEEKEE